MEALSEMLKMAGLAKMNAKKSCPILTSINALLHKYCPHLRRKQPKDDRVDNSGVLPVTLCLVIMDAIAGGD